MTLLVHRCLGRQIAAHPLAADEARRMLQGDRQKRLWNGALAAPSHARVRIIHRSNRDAYPISRDGPLPDLPAGRFCSKWRSDQSTKGGVEDHPLLCRQAGEGQPRALPHQSRRRGGRASSTGRSRARFQRPRPTPFTLAQMDPRISNSAFSTFRKPFPPRVRPTYAK